MWDSGVIVDSISGFIELDDGLLEALPEYCDFWTVNCPNCNAEINCVCIKGSSVTSGYRCKCGHDVWIEYPTRELH